MKTLLIVLSIALLIVMMLVILLGIKSYRRLLEIEREHDRMMKEMEDA